MSDLAAGSSAALQLQQNMAAAPYVEQQASAAAEETQLKLQQERLKASYAPQMAAAKAEQDQLILKDQRRKELAAEVGYVTDKESTAKLQQWMQTDEGKKASESEIIKKSAVLKLQAGLTEQGSKLMAQAEKLDAVDIANQAKKLNLDDESITKASIMLDSVPEGKEEEFINRLPSESLKAIYSKVGEDNFKALSGAEKKQVVSRLMLNGKTLAAEQKRALDLKKTELITQTRKDIATNHEDESTRRKEMDIEARGERQDKDLAARKERQDADLAAKETRLKEDLAARLERERLKGTTEKELEAMKEKAKKELEKMKEDFKKSLPTKEKDTTSKDFRGWSAYTKERDALIKSTTKEEQALTDQITKAEAKVIKAKDASWYEFGAPDLTKASATYDELVAKRDALRKERATKELDLVLSMPEFASKEKIVADLQKQLKIFPAKEAPKDAKDVSAAAVAAKPAATSNKPAAQKFEEGKVYTDAKGNKAKYVNGKWEPQ